jgi:hypothetical protein
MPQIVPKTQIPKYLVFVFEIPTNSTKANRHMKKFLFSPKKFKLNFFQIKKILPEKKKTKLNKVE